MGFALQAALRGLFFLFLLALGACNNSPHPAGAEGENTLFTAFDERSPRYLDPTSSYSAPEAAYAFHIYEPLYSYHYLKRPYQLTPRAAAAVVRPYYLDAQGLRLADDAAPGLIAQSVYEIPLRPGLRYAPHPAFARDAKGQLLYHALTPEQIAAKRSTWDFAERGSRELVAEDFVFALKRHASPRLEAPLFALFSEHVLGLKEYGELLRVENAKLMAQPARELAGQAFSGFAPLALERRRGRQQTPAAHSHQGQVSAVAVLDGHDLSGARALGGRCLLRADRHERGRLGLEPMACGYGPFHDDRVRAG